MKSSKTNYSDEIEFRKAMMPKNGPAKLFLGVAKLFDYSYRPQTVAPWLIALRT